MLESRGAVSSMAVRSGWLIDSIHRTYEDLYYAEFHRL